VHLADLPTPFLALDLAVLDRNLQRMSAKMLRHGVDLRPHMKTAKCVEVARRAVAGHSGAITVSTVAEARLFAEAGFTDITWAVTAVPDKLPYLEPAVRTGACVTLLADDVELVRRLDAEAGRLGLTFLVLVEVDSGLGRTGVLPVTEGVCAVGTAIHRAAHLDLAGVLTRARIDSFEVRTDGDIADPLIAFFRRRIQRYGGRVA